jgi:hypothetical protein
MGAVKTKLASAPSWLKEREEAVFMHGGCKWKCQFQSRFKTHINVETRQILLSDRGTPGISARTDAAQIAAICESFNSQAAAIAANPQPSAAQREEFSEIKFEWGEDVKVAFLAHGLKLRIRLAEGPRWLFNSKRTFYLEIPGEQLDAEQQDGEKQNEIWECAFESDPDTEKSSFIDVDNRRILLCPDNMVFKSADVTRERLSTLFKAMSRALPAWREALQSERAAALAQRATELKKYGPIKRQPVCSVYRNADAE